MDDKLKLVKNIDPLKETNNFWRVCPRLLQYLPESACGKGKPQTNASNGKIQEEPECPWWINSEKHHFCFWRYLKDMSDVDGVMQELTQAEVAQLFGWSNTKTHFMIKQAEQELTEALKTYGALELILDSSDEEFQAAATYRPDDESFE